MQHIEERQYAAPYATGGREVVKLGVHFSSKTRNIAECIIRRAGCEDMVISY